MKKRFFAAALSALLLAGEAVFAAAAPDETEALLRLEATEWTAPSIGLKMKRIPAGRFTMGSPEDEIARGADETQHEVTLTKPYYMCVTEVTQREFYQLMLPEDFDYEGWKFKRGPIAEGTAFCWRYPTKKGLIFRDDAVGGERTDLNPMECVTWERACEFARKLTEIEREAGRLPEGFEYRLPTEAEWEYACRAGTEGPYNVDVDFTKYSSILKFAWVDTSNGVNFGTREVGGGRRPNAWGLYDMHGNVYEWCLDWYGPYQEGETTDPSGPSSGEEKVVRGGSFSGVDEKDSDAHLEEQVHPFLRSAARYGVPPDLGYLAIVGFRLVLAPEMEKQTPSSQTTPGAAVQTAQINAAQGENR